METMIKENEVIVTKETIENLVEEFKFRTENRPSNLFNNREEECTMLKNIGWFYIHEDRFYMFKNTIEKAIEVPKCNSFKYVCSTLISKYKVGFYNIVSSYAAKKFSYDSNLILERIKDTINSIYVEKVPTDEVAVLLTKAYFKANTISEFYEMIDTKLSSNKEKSIVFNGIIKDGNYETKTVDDILKLRSAGKYYLYAGVLPIYKTNRVAYIGSGTNTRLLNDRKDEYLSEFISNIKGAKRTVRFIPLFSFDSEEKARIAETILITILKNLGYNLANINHYESINGIVVRSKEDCTKLLNQINSNRDYIRAKKIKTIGIKPFISFDELNSLLKLN